MTKSPSNVHHIRELRNHHTGCQAVILGKGPSLDHWYDSGAYRNRPENQVIMAVNETVILPGLDPDYWFWFDVDHLWWASEIEGLPANVPQVIPDAHRRGLDVPDRPTLFFQPSSEAPDDPYAVLGVGAPSAAALFCCGLWGCRQVLLVGFDSKDENTMRTYARCLTPWLIEAQNRDSSYKSQNRIHDRIIEDQGLEVTWYHRTVAAEEIERSHQKFVDKYGPVIPREKRT